MYKEIKFMYTDSIRSELIEIFNELNIEKYMNLSGLEATWAKNFRHLNSRVWPGTDSLMFMVIDEEKTKELLARLRILKNELVEGAALFATVTPLDELL